MSSKNTKATPVWKSKKILPIILQIIFVLIVVSLCLFLVSNALQGLKQIGIKLGFGFLNSSASFAITDKIIDYTPRDSYGKALLVGLLNTVKVGIVGIILSAFIGTFIGIGRLSDNWLIRAITKVYVELIRNTPLLIQIFFLYFAVFLTFPQIEEKANLFKLFYFSNRGNAIPWFTANACWPYWLVSLLIGLVLAIIIGKKMLNKQIEQGKRTYPILWSIGIFFVSIVAAYCLTAQLPLALSIPTINRRLFQGGYVINIEFASILIGLTIYHSAFIAEIVRAGIMAVPKGQIEAAKALGLKKSTIMRLITLPQAGRIIIPSATSQFLNLFKNSTLAIAVGYTDLFSIGNTIINQTGRAIEIMVLIASVYLIVSLIISAFMNWFNKHYQLVER